MQSLALNALSPVAHSDALVESESRSARAEDTLAATDAPKGSGGGEMPGLVLLSTKWTVAIEYTIHESS